MKDMAFYDEEVADCDLTTPSWVRKSYDDSKSIVCLGSNHVGREFFWNSSTHDHRASYTYLSTILSIILADTHSDIEDPTEKFVKMMNATQGALMVTSTMQMVLGSIGSWRHVVRFLSPLSTILLVSLSDFGLYRFGFSMLGRCVEIGLPELVVLLIFTQYISHKKRRPTYFYLGLLYGHILNSNRVDLCPHSHSC